MHDDFTIEQAEDMQSTPVLTLKGRLDAAGAQMLREECIAVRDMGLPVLAVSLAEITFVASSGLGTFLLINDEFKNQGQKVIFVGVNSNVMQVIRLLNLEQFLDIRATLADVFVEKQN
jgi:anti-sigma B factor antagonist